jgi:ribosomal protein RSM22 (predicted rRNA methylase)
MPATFAAVEAVLSRVPLEDIVSILDLGAGPGTATLAASLRWPKCAHLHLIEGDAYMSGLSQQLLKSIPEIAPQKLSFHHENLLNISLKGPYDLILLSYVLNELSPGDQERVLKRAWDECTKGVVIVMPGTPREYQQLMVLRDLLIDCGAFIAAPCPHHNACPLANGDWCHFSVRLARSYLHRSIKNVSLSYEDEKFSYIVALRAPAPRSSARIIRKPLKRSGHMTLDLCTKEGLKRQTLSKRDKAYYKTATKVIWGDDWNM